MRRAVAQPPVVAGEVADAVRDDFRGTDSDCDRRRERRDAMVRIVVPLEEGRDVLRTELAQPLESAVAHRAERALVGMEERLRHPLGFLRAEDPGSELADPRVRVGEEGNQVLVPADVRVGEKRRQRADRGILDAARVEVAVTEQRPDRRLVRETGQELDRPVPQALLLVLETLQRQGHHPR